MKGHAKYLNVTTQNIVSSSKDPFETLSQDEPKLMEN